MKNAGGNSKNTTRLPLFLTAAIHLGILLLALFAPKLVPKHLRIPEVYQVELYTAPLEKPPQIKTDPPPVKPVTTTPRVTAATPPPAAARPKVKAKPTIAAPVQRSSARTVAISLSPIKERLARENREREEQADQNRKQTEQVALLKLDLKKQRADEQARTAASLARAAIAEAYRATSARSALVSEDKPAKSQKDITAPTATPLLASNTPTPGQLAAKVAYKARLQEHLRRHWQLPVLQDWDKKLSATVVIRIKRNGSVIKTDFETHSANPRFDQYVKRAVGQSSPLPPLPHEFEQKTEEIAVTFTPGGLQ